MITSLDIVIPCFGNSALINETLESLAVQTNKNFKVILVIDQADDTYYVEMAKSFQARLNMELLCLKGNFGITNATVKGIEQSSSHWVALLDHDDWLMPETVDTLLKHIAKLSTTVIAVFTGRVDSSTKYFHDRMSGKLYQGNVLGNFYGSPLQASISHNFLSHLKVYRKDNFKLLNDPRIDGIQDWYWLLSNSTRGQYSYIDLPLYVHRVHALQNTNTEVFLKSINKIQLQRQFINETFSPKTASSDSLNVQFSQYIKENISRISVSSIFVMNNGKFEIFVFNPTLILSLLSIHNSTDGVIVLVPRSQLDVTFLITILGMESARDLIGIAVSRELVGSTLLLKSQGALFDFALPLDPESELFCSFAGLTIKYLGGSQRYLRIDEIGRIREFKADVGRKFSIWYLKHNSMFLRLVPVGSRRRNYLRKFYKKAIS